MDLLMWRTALVHVWLELIHRWLSSRCCGMNRMLHAWFCIPPTHVPRLVSYSLLSYHYPVVRGHCHPTHTPVYKTKTLGCVHTEQMQVQFWKLMWKAMLKSQLLYVNIIVIFLLLSGIKYCYEHFTWPVSVTAKQCRAPTATCTIFLPFKPSTSWGFRTWASVPWPNL